MKSGSGSGSKGKANRSMNPPAIGINVPQQPSQPKQQQQQTPYPPESQAPGYPPQPQSFPQPPAPQYPSQQQAPVPLAPPPPASQPQQQPMAPPQSQVSTVSSQRHHSGGGGSHHGRPHHHRHQQQQQPPAGYAPAPAPGAPIRVAPGQPVMAPGQPMMAPPGQPMMAAPGQPVMAAPGQPVMAGPIQMQPSARNPMGAAAGGAWYAQNADFAHYLRNASSFHVKQKVEMLEVFLGWETANKYVIKDQLGNDVFFAAEESGCCGRQCCGQYRSFTMRLRNMAGQDLLAFERSLDCSCCCNLCCPDELEARSASGQLLGAVTERFSICAPSWKLRDAAGQVIFYIDGPVCVCSMCPGQNVDFIMTSAATGQEVGKITKEWSGWARELFTDADFFSITFPADLDPSIKAVCLGALFLIDFEYFESSATKHRNQRRLFDT